MRWKRLPALIVVAFVVAVLDVTFFNRLTIYYVSFDPIMLFTICYSLLFGSNEGAFAGLLCGMFADVTIARFVGPSIFMFVLVGYLSYKGYIAIKRRLPFPMWLVVFMSCAIAYFIRNLIEVVAYGITPNVDLLIGIIGTAFLTGVFTPFGVKICNVIGPVFRRTSLRDEKNSHGMVLK